MLTIRGSQDLQTGSLRNAQLDMRLLRLEGMPTPETRVPTAELLRFRRMPWPYTDPNDPDEPTTPFSSSLMLRNDQCPKSFLCLQGIVPEQPPSPNECLQPIVRRSKAARPKEKEDIKLDTCLAEKNLL